MKKPLVKRIKEKCMVEITTTDQKEDYVDAGLSIKFLNGTLKGMTYKLTIDLKDYEEAVVNIVEKEDYGPLLGFDPTDEF